MIEEFIEKLSTLLQGRIPVTIDIDSYGPGPERDLAGMLNQFIEFMHEIHEFIIPLSQGELQDIRIRSGNFMASPFKELHSRLRHLTWQATQVANGDYKQRVDFMGDFSIALNSMIISLDHNERMLKKKIDELEHALHHITKLEGILTICSNCKRIRLQGADPKKQESWLQIESYISKRTDAQFSHGICPECVRKLYPELMG